MKKYLPPILIALTIFGTFVIFAMLETEDKPEVITEKFRSSESPKAGVEMKKGRDEFFNKILRDPKTGQIPDRIREKEIEFARNIPERQLLRAKGGSTAEITWKEGGPNLVGGRTRALAIDRSDPTGNTIVAAGVSGGVWKSTDAGNSWTLTTDPDQNPSVTSIAQHPTQPSIWYYSAGEIRGNSAGARGGSAPLFGIGIYRSTDNADSWQLLPATFNDDKAWNSEVNFTSRIKVNPQTGSVFLATNGFGIIRSTDGSNFTEIVLGTFAGHFFVDIDIHDDGTILASLSERAAGTPGDPPNPGIFYSTDDGESWTEVTPVDFPSEHERTVVAIAPSNSDIFYSFTYTGNGSGSNEDVRFFKYEIAADTAFDRSSNLPPTFDVGVGGINTQFNYNMMLTVDPADENFVLLGATNLFRSDDGFSTTQTDRDETWIGGYWKRAGQDTPDVSEPFLWPEQHPDQHFAVFDPVNSGRVWAAHDGGLSLTQDIRAAEIEWEFKNDGYNTVQFYTVELPKTDGDTRVMGGTQDNGSLYFDHTLQLNQDFWDLSSGDGSYAHFGQEFAYVSSQNGSVLQLDFDAIKETLSLPLTAPDTLISPFEIGGPFWTFIQPRQKQNSLFIHPFVVSPIGDNIMFFPDGRFLFKSTSLGQVPKNLGSSESLPTDTWTRLDSLALPNDYIITALEYSTSNPRNRLYWGGSKFSPSDNPVIHRIDFALFTETKNNQFKDISIPVSIGPPPGSYLHDIAVNEANADEVIAVFSNYKIESIYHSTDAGDTWSAVQGNLAGTDAVPGPSVRRAKIMPIDESSNLYIIGTSAGVFTTTSMDGANTFWEREATGLLGFNVAEALDIRTSDKTIAVGTHGRGVWIGDVQVTVSNEEELLVEAPGQFELKQNFPNPFNPSTTIQFALSEPSQVTIQVFDINGRRVTTLLNDESHNSGQHAVSFDASSLASGVYFYRINATANSGQSFSDVKRMTLIK
ncbi:MAG TPA: T9SS type A sorting domain-containing protein [Balneolaceae bacterium]|nr:T9SS type A sorting domain-containing protein [Balneolaceae bacterium]